MVWDNRTTMHRGRSYESLLYPRDLRRGAVDLRADLPQAAHRAQQSGHITAVGFDLYCQLLRQSVDRLKGRKDAPRGETSFKADFIAFSEAAYAREDPKLVLPAFLPSSWLAETKLRITAYRELSEAGTLKAIDALEKSWRDRFGRLPEAASRLLEINRIKALAGAASAQAPAPADIIKNWDKDGDGAVSKDEWAAAGRPAERFDAVDANKDGKISAAELAAAMAAMRQRNGG